MRHTNAKILYYFLPKRISGNKAIQSAHYSADTEWAVNLPELYIAANV